jgi:hypothetical protein
MLYQCQHLVSKIHQALAGFRVSTTLAEHKTTTDGWLVVTGT